MKADEYRYWQSRPVHERMTAVSELTLAAYEMKGPVCLPPRSQWPIVCLERPVKVEKHISGPEGPA
jgi:hypothetical protein